MSEETRCRICGRRLTVPESVKREIGPVCWGRFKSGEITPVTATLEDFCNEALKKEAEEKKQAVAQAWKAYDEATAQARKKKEEDSSVRGD